MLMENVRCKASLMRRQITWEIKVSKEIIGIIIKDESLIQAWDKVDLPLGHLYNINNPLCMKGH